MESDATETRARRPRKAGGGVNSGWIVSLLTGLATQIPMLIVYGGAALLGIVRWKRHPKVSRLVVSSASFLAMLQIGVTVVYSTMGLWLYDTGISAEYVGWVYTLLGASDAFASALGHGVLIAAVFVERPAVSAEAG